MYVKQGDLSGNRAVFMADMPEEPPGQESERFIVAMKRGNSRGVKGRRKVDYGKSGPGESRRGSVPRG